MAESARPGRRRARRSTRVSKQLAAARERNAEQLARQRQQEEDVEAALGEFFDAGDQIAAAEEECRKRVEPHERAIEQLRRQRDEQVATQEGAQGLAALAIHEADRTVEQVGELLGLGEKPTRRLIATGREVRKRAAGAGTAEGGTPSSVAAEEDGRNQAGRAGERQAGNAEAAPTGAATASSGGGGWPAGPAGGDGHEPAAAPDPGAVSA